MGIAINSFKDFVFMAKDDKKDAEKEEDKKDDKKEEKKDDKEEGGEEKKEGEGGEGAEGEGAPKKSKKKLIIIGAVALVVLLGGAAGAYFAFFHKSAEQAEAEKEGEKGAPKKAVYYTLPEFLVNLSSSSKQTSFLKMTVVLELESQLDVVSMEGDLPKLLDTFNTYLRELRASDLAGSAGIQRLREELLLRAQKVSDPVKINDVLFKEIIVQ